jgi:hypothetical protein
MVPSVPIAGQQSLREPNSSVHSVAGFVSAQPVAETAVHKRQATARPKPLIQPFRCWRSNIRARSGTETFLTNFTRAARKRL